MSDAERRQPHVGLIAPLLCALLALTLGLVTLNQATRYGVSQALIATLLGY